MRRPKQPKLLSTIYDSDGQIIYSGYNTGQANKIWAEMLVKSKWWSIRDPEGKEPKKDGRVSWGSLR